MRTSQCCLKYLILASSVLIKPCLDITLTLLTKQDVKCSTSVSCVRVAWYSKTLSSAPMVPSSTSNIWYAIGGSTLTAALPKISTRLTNSLDKNPTLDMVKVLRTLLTEHQIGIATDLTVAALVVATPTLMDPTDVMVMAATGSDLPVAAMVMAILALMDLTDLMAIAATEIDSLMATTTDLAETAIHTLLAAIMYRTDVMETAVTEIAIPLTLEMDLTGVMVTAEEEADTPTLTEMDLTDVTEEAKTEGTGIKVDLCRSVNNEIYF